MLLLIFHRDAKHFASLSFSRTWHWKLKGGCTVKEWSLFITNYKWLIYKNANIQLPFFSPDGTSGVSTDCRVSCDFGWFSIVPKVSFDLEWLSNAPWASCDLEWLSNVPNPLIPAGWLVVTCIGTGFDATGVMWLSCDNVGPVMKSPNPSSVCVTVENKNQQYNALIYVNKTCHDAIICSTFSFLKKY